MTTTPHKTVKSANVAPIKLYSLHAEKTASIQEIVYALCSMSIKSYNISYLILVNCPSE